MMFTKANIIIPDEAFFFFNASFFFFHQTVENVETSIYEVLGQLDTYIKACYCY